MLAYISERADRALLQALRERGVEVRTIAPHPMLSEPVASHADMLMLDIGNTVLVPREFSAELTGFDDIITISEAMGDSYPRDVLLNIALVGKVAIANTRTASPTALAYLAEHGWRVRHVNQGYAHCSTCSVGDGAIITADEGIARVAREEGIDALLIHSGHIALPPYGYGFIGGASGSTDGAVWLCGSLDHHPDGEMIRKFCLGKHIEIIELSNAPLSDVGGIIFK